MTVRKHISASLIALTLLSTSPAFSQNETAIFPDGIAAYATGHYSGHNGWSRPWRMIDKQGELSRLIGDGVYAYNAGKYSEAIDFWEQAAQKDDVEALIVLGRMHAGGLHVPQSIEKAKAYHLKASQLLRKADNRTDEALEYVLPYAELEYDDAKLELVRVYLGLWHTESRDKAHAILSPEFLAQSAEANYLKGTLAFRQTKGSMKERMFARIEWQRKSGVMGYAPGQVANGLAYAKGRGVDKSYENAAIWYKKAMAQNYPPGFYMLGKMYSNGDGVERNDKEAAGLIEKAANLGHSSAQEDTAYNYRNGRGVQKDLQTAIEWYAKARKTAFAEHDYKKASRISRLIQETEAELKAEKP